MERNPNDLDSARTGAAGSGAAAGTDAYGSSASGGSATPGTTPGGNTGIGGTASGYGATSTPVASDMSGSAAMADESPTEQAKEKAQEGAEAAREKLSQASDRAREIKTSVEQKIAERLEMGANKLRQRRATDASGGVGSPAFAGADGAAPAATGDQRMNELQGNVASGMEKTADWLRNGDMRSTIEEQAKSNPGRTLLVALGLGYLLGKTLRR